MTVYAVNITLYRTWIIDEFRNYFRAIIGSETEDLDFTKDDLVKDVTKIDRKIQKTKYKVLYFFK